MTVTEPKVNKVTQSVAFSPTGALQSSYIVNFSVGAHGPFQAQIPAGEFTADRVVAEMKKTADVLNALPAEA
jgi:hypothetical protein